MNPRFQHLLAAVTAGFLAVPYGLALFLIVALLILPGQCLRSVGTIILFFGKQLQHKATALARWIDFSLL